MAFSHQKFTFLILCFITSLIVQAQRQQLNSIGRNVIPRPPGPPKDLPGGGKLEIAVETLGIQNSKFHKHKYFNLKLYYIQLYTCDLL